MISWYFVNLHYIIPYQQNTNVNGQDGFKNEHEEEDLMEKEEEKERERKRETQREEDKKLR